MAAVKKPQPKTRKSTTSTPSSKPKFSSKDKIKRPPPKQVKTKPATSILKSKRNKKPQYTEAQLKLPAVNSIVPANAAIKTGKGAGKKRNKIYVDDTESMMTILAMVNAEKEGQIESKVMKARQLEEIREARKKEAEKRAEGKKGKLEEVKMSLKRKGRGKGRMENGEEDGKKVVSDERDEEKKRKKRKSVSFV